MPRHLDSTCFGTSITSEYFALRHSFLLHIVCFEKVVTDHVKCLVCVFFFGLIISLISLYLIICFKKVTWMASEWYEHMNKNEVLQMYCLVEVEYYGRVILMVDWESIPFFFYIYILNIFILIFSEWYYWVVFSQNLNEKPSGWEML